MAKVELRGCPEIAKSGYRSPEAPHPVAKTFQKQGVSEDPPAPGWNRSDRVKRIFGPASTMWKLDHEPCLPERKVRLGYRGEKKTSESAVWPNRTSDRIGQLPIRSLHGLLNFWEERKISQNAERLGAGGSEVIFFSCQRAVFRAGSVRRSR